MWQTWCLSPLLFCNRLSSLFITYVSVTIVLVVSDFWLYTESCFYEHCWCCHYPATCVSHFLWHMSRWNYLCQALVWYLIVLINKQKKKPSALWIIIHCASKSIHCYNFVFCVHYDTYTVYLKFRSVLRLYCLKTALWSILVLWGQCIYRGADKSLARPGKKKATFPAFYGTWRFITTFTTVHHLSLLYPNQSIPLPITLLTGAASFLPGQAEDLSAPRFVYVMHVSWFAFQISPNLQVIYNSKSHCCFIYPFHMSNSWFYIQQFQKRILILWVYKYIQETLYINVVLNCYIEMLFFCKHNTWLGPQTLTMGSL